MFPGAPAVVTPLNILLGKAEPLFAHPEGEVPGLHRGTVPQRPADGSALSQVFLHPNDFCAPAHADATHQERNQVRSGVILTGLQPWGSSRLPGTLRPLKAFCTQGPCLHHGNPPEALRRLLPLLTHSRVGEAQSRASVTRSAPTGSQDTWLGIRPQTLVVSWEACRAQGANRSLEERPTATPRAPGSGAARTQALTPQSSFPHSPCTASYPLRGRPSSCSNCQCPGGLAPTPVAQVCHWLSSAPGHFPHILSFLLSNQNPPVQMTKNLKNSCFVSL